MSYINEDIEWRNSDAADDDLHTMMDILRDQESIFRAIARNIQDETFSKIKSDEFAAARAVIIEALHDLFHADYHRLAEISGSIEWPIQIPNYVPDRLAIRVPTNPQTYLDQGETL